MEKKRRILTGHRPTGPRHLGHLVGTLETWEKLQDVYECFFLVADLHILTTDYAHPDKVSRNILELLADWMATGIDPERSRIIRQSALPEHSELAVLLGNLVSVSRLERIPTFKEQVKQLRLNPSLGLLSYPVLQSADILLYKADTVPVGEDQLPHLELSRELARRFNQLYGQTFPEPQAMLSRVPHLPGVDNRVMHTSYGNTIALGDTPDETTRKVMSMFTDPTRIHPTDPGHIEGNPVFVYLELFNPNKEEVEEQKKLYEAGKIGDIQIKKRLAFLLNEYLDPLRQKRSRFIHQPEKLEEILYEGTQSAMPVVQATLEEVKEKMGMHRLNPLPI